MDLAKLGIIAAIDGETYSAVLSGNKTKAKQMI